MVGEASDDVGSDTIDHLEVMMVVFGLLVEVWMCALWTLPQEPWLNQGHPVQNPCLGLTLNGVPRAGISLLKS